MTGLLVRRRASSRLLLLYPAKMALAILERVHQRSDASASCMASVDRISASGVTTAQVRNIRRGKAAKELVT